MYSELFYLICEVSNVSNVLRLLNQGKITCKNISWSVTFVIPQDKNEIVQNFPTGTQKRLTNTSAAGVSPGSNESGKQLKVIYYRQMTFNIFLFLYYNIISTIKSRIDVIVT